MRIKNPWTTINNAILHDKTLSFAAKGIAAYLMACETDVDTQQLFKLDSEETVRNALNELYKANYLIKSDNCMELVVAEETRAVVRPVKPRANQTFDSMLAEFLKVNPDLYPKSMTDEFSAYWKEENLTTKKQRWQSESFFDLARRLKTWEANNNKSKSSVASAPSFSYTPPTPNKMPVR